MAFIIDRKSAQLPPLVSAPGKYRSVVTHVKGELKNGNEIAVVTFQTEAGETQIERLYNKPQNHWKIQQLIEATPEFTMEDGTKIDFDQSDTFVPFLQQFVGLKVGLDVQPDTFVGSDGTPRTNHKVKRFIKPDSF
jgi:hypothetical protein